MRSRAAAIALALSLLCSRGASAAPLPVPLTEALRQRAEATRLSFVARVSEIDGGKSKQKTENAANDRKRSESDRNKDEPEGQGKKGGKDDGDGKSDARKKAGGEKPDEGKEVTDLRAKDSGEGKDSSAKSGDLTSDSNAKNTTSTDGDKGAGDDGDERSRIGRMTTSEMIAEARAHSNRLMKGGFIEFVEWLFVFILVAPGTFPAIGCILLSCSSFWRRRIGSASTSAPTSGPETVPRAVSGSAQSAYQRVPHGDHGALVARARVKVGSDERDSDIS